MNRVFWMKLCMYEGNIWNGIYNPVQYWYHIISDTCLRNDMFGSRTEWKYQLHWFFNCIEVIHALVHHVYILRCVRSTSRCIFIISLQNFRLYNTKISEIIHGFSKVANLKAHSRLLFYKSLDSVRYCHIFHDVEEDSCGILNILSSSRYHISV